MKFSKRFLPTYDEYEERHGEEFEVLHKLTPEEVGPDYEEVGDMYLIRFADGTEVNAWPEEVTAEYAASMAGVRRYKGFQDTQEVEIT